MSTVSSLSPSALRLVRLMQQLNFGRLEGLGIRKGEPTWDSPPRVVREVKFGADNEPRPEATQQSFAPEVGGGRVIPAPQDP